MRAPRSFSRSVLAHLSVSVPPTLPSSRSSSIGLQTPTVLKRDALGSILDAPGIRSWILVYRILLAHAFTHRAISRCLPRSSKSSAGMDWGRIRPRSMTFTAPCFRAISSSTCVLRVQRSLAAEKCPPAYKGRPERATTIRIGFVLAVSLQRLLFPRVSRTAPGSSGGTGRRPFRGQSNNVTVGV